MKRFVPIACGAVLSLGALAGCGSDDGGDDSDTNASDGGGGDYCSEVETMKGKFDDMSSPKASIDDFSAMADSINGASESAPDDVSSQWKSFDKAMGDAVSKLEDTGLATDKPLADEVKKATKKDPKKAQELSQAMAGLNGDQDLQKDTKKIETNVKDECDIELSESPDDSGSEGSGDSN